MEHLGRTANSVRLCLGQRRTWSAIVLSRLWVSQFAQSHSKIHLPADLLNTTLNQHHSAIFDSKSLPCFLFLMRPLVDLYFIIESSEWPVTARKHKACWTVGGRWSVLWWTRKTTRDPRVSGTSAIYRTSTNVRSGASRSPLISSKRSKKYRIVHVLRIKSEHSMTISTDYSESFTIGRYALRS